MTILITVAEAGTPAAQTADYVCTGSNDQEVINQAIAAAGAAAGGGEVYISAGMYSLTGSVIDTADSVSIVGAGAGQTILQTSGPGGWQYTNTSTGFTINEVVAFCSVNNFSCSGITVDAQTNGLVINEIAAIPQGSSVTSEAISGTPCSNGVITDNEVLLTPGHCYGIWNVRGENITISNNTVNGDCTPTNTSIEEEGIETYGGNTVLITGNTVENVGHAGIWAPTAAPATSRPNHRERSDTGQHDRLLVYGHSAVDEVRPNNGGQDTDGVTISGNVITNGLQFGIILAKR